MSVLKRRREGGRKREEGRKEERKKGCKQRDATKWMQTTEDARMGSAFFSFFPLRFICCGQIAVTGGAQHA